MGSMQIVFLFDLNACKDILYKSREELNKKLLHIRLACLRLLTDFSKTSNLRWGFKFFDSCGSITQTMCKFFFQDVSLEAFETLENEICVRYERHASYCEALAESSGDSVNINNNSTDNSEKEKHMIAQVKLLQLALNQILSEFQWENIDMWSPSSKRIKDRALYLGKRNFLFLLSDFKDDDDILYKYFGLDNKPVKSKFSNIILPHTLQEQLLDKADVHWVWINTCQEQKFLSTSSNGVLPLLSDTLQSIHGSLIPLSLLSQPLYHMKSFTCTDMKLFQSGMPLSSNICGSFHNSLLPFSSLFLQSLHQPFYSKVITLNNKCSINFDHNSLHIPVQVTAILNKNTLKINCKGKTRKQSSVNCKYSDIAKLTWTKFVVQGAVSKYIHYTAYDVLLCFPSSIESRTAISGNLVMLNKSLYHERLSLVLECITDSGLKMPGLLIPMSYEAALISILDPIVYLLQRPDFKILDSNFIENNNFEKSMNSALETQNLRTELNNQTCCDKEMITPSSDSSLKHFQMECLESWFKPTSAGPSLMSFIQPVPSNSSKIDAFHKMLQRSVKGGNNLSAKSSKKPVLHASEVQSTSVCKSNEVDEVFADLNEEELISTAKDIYNSALEPSSSVMDCAKKIVKMVSNFFKKQSSSSFEEDVQSFMKNNFLTTVRRISEKYVRTLHNEEDKYIKECQIQVFLALEMEALLLPPDKSNCVDMVTSFLRIMPFCSGASQRKKLLCETLRENYSHYLYDVLVEIGEELEIPMFNETESSDSPDILSSELVDGELLSSIVSSNISERSSSSLSNNCGQRDRKLVRHRSDISDTTKSRQVLLPGTSPKKKMAKYAQKKAVRYSPRLASRKNDGPSKTVEKPRNVRRNLFPKDKSNQTPKKSKCRSTTPRSHKRNRDLKTKFVAETPSHKQNRSALQRRKSFIESTEEIAESPTIRKTSKADSSIALHQKLLKTKGEPSNQSTGSSLKKEATTFSFKQHTPESKKRLSLKLFSKLLSSPTARMGLRKCTKRLFDQVSPKKCDESCKKQKSSDESKLASKSSKEI